MKYTTEIYNLMKYTISQRQTMADGSEIMNSPTLKNFSLDRVDIPSIKLLNIKTHLVYDGTRIKWSNDLISLKNFTENIVGLVGCWRSPGGQAAEYGSGAPKINLCYNNCALVTPFRPIFRTPTT
jgi:hypothetical protein